jgi:hypothetical protein
MIMVFMGWPQVAKTKTPQAFWRPAAIGFWLKYYRSRKCALGLNQ